MARIPKQRVIFDAEKYDLDYLRETRDSYSPITDADFEDSISYDMGEHDLRDLMEMDWRSNEKALDAFLGKSILVRYSPVNYDGGFVQFNLNDLDDLLHTYTSPLHRVDKVWDEDGHLFLSGKWPDNSPLLVEVRKLTDEGERAMDSILTAERRGDFDAVRGTFHAMWDDPALVSTPRYTELALGMPAEEAGYLSMMVSMMDYGSPVKEGELYSILCGDLVAVGFDFETGENRDLSADEMSRVADYFTEVSKPGSGIEEVIAIRMGQHREEARSEDGRVTLKGEAQASRAASEKLAEGRDIGSPARDDHSIV